MGPIVTVDEINLFPTRIHIKGYEMINNVEYGREL